MKNYIDKCRKYTMVNPKHFPDLFNMVKIINNENIDGSIIETGVWKGGCIMMLMLKQKEFNENRLFYLFDTYEGLPPPSNNDSLKAHTLYNKIKNENNLLVGNENIADGLDKNHKKYSELGGIFYDFYLIHPLYKNHKKYSELGGIPGISNDGTNNKWCNSSLDDVKKNIYSINYNKDNIFLLRVI